MTSVSLSPRPRVAVVLCTWRAGRHLEAQLDSLADQTWPIDVHVFDDDSGDDTQARARAHRVVTRVTTRCRNVGFVRNFALGMADVLARGYAYLALADQDDVWDADRVSVGMQRLLAAEASGGTARPCLVHSDLRTTDADGQVLHDSYLGQRGYAVSSRRNLSVALGQCGVMGNTVLINRALAELALPFPHPLFVHDWWLSLLAELWGERLFIERATVSYRLHTSNASNTHASLHGTTPAALRRLGLRGLLSRDFRLPFKEDNRLDALQALLAGNGHRPPLDPEDRRLIEDFVAYLSLSASRPTLLANMLRGDFVRRQPGHRARFALALLTTRRYAPASSKSSRKSA